MGTPGTTAPPRQARPRAAAVELVALILALVGVQAWYSGQTASRVLYEELAESVRSPVWIAHRLVYNGTASNVGWYALIAVCYQLFGFSFWTAKVIRMVLAAVSLACLAHLLTRWLTPRQSLVPLAVVGLSPAALTFNSIATVYGTDLQWVAIWAWLIWRATAGPPVAAMMAHAALGTCAMIACLMWPPCLLYLPIVAIVYAAERRSTGRRYSKPGLIVLIAAFAVPFLAAFFGLQNRLVWLHDPATGSGVFRGGGGGVVDSLRVYAINVWRVAADLALSGSSYYFWVPRPDLSGVLGLIPAAAILALLPRVWRNGPGARPLIIAAVVTGAGALALTSAATGPPGLRRATPVLAAFYVLYLACWHFLCRDAAASPRRRTHALQFGLLSLLLVHHALAVAPNVAAVRGGQPATEGHWFAPGEMPQASVDRWVAAVAAGEALDCRIVKLPAESCRYAEIYAAIEARLRWPDSRVRPEIKARDPVTGNEIPLSPETWPFGSRR